jgi:hypothetical protein
MFLFVKANQAVPSNATARSVDQFSFSAFHGAIVFELILVGKEKATCSFSELVYFC